MKRKYTLPARKTRFKPFFRKPVPQDHLEDVSSVIGLAPGIVSLVPGRWTVNLVPGYGEPVCIGGMVSLHGTGCGEPTGTGDWWHRGQ